MWTSRSSEPQRIAMLKRRLQAKAKARLEELELGLTEAERINRALTDKVRRLEADLEHAQKALIPFAAVWSKEIYLPDQVRVCDADVEDVFDPDHHPGDLQIGDFRQAASVLAGGFHERVSRYIKRLKAALTPFADVWIELDDHPNGEDIDAEDNLFVVAPWFMDPKDGFGPFKEGHFKEAARLVYPWKGIPS